MNVLHTLLKVSFTPLTLGDSASTAPLARGKGSKLKVVSHQLLRFRLTIAYDNEAGDAEMEQAAQAFLSMVGIHSLEAAWTYLFSTVQIVPFMVSKSGASAALGSPQRSAPLRQRSSPPPSATPLQLTSIGNNFVFGTPVFWSNHTYTHTERPTETRANGHGSLRGSSPTETFTSSALPLFANPQASMPYVTATASPSFANTGNTNQTPRDSRGSLSEINTLGAGSSSDVRCEIIGTVQTVAVNAGDPRVVSASGGVAVVPRLLESSFTVELALPDLDAASLRGVDTTLVMVVLLPLTFDSSRIGISADPDQPSILRSVLARSLGQTQVETAAAAALVLGSGVMPVELTEPLLCLSSTSPLSNDRLVLNLSLTNVTSSAARLYSTSLDLHSSCVLPDAETTSGGGGLANEAAESHFTANPLWGELRPGANLSSMRTIDLLAKLVTITPVLVGEERPPFILHPGETYSFEFVIEVLPQLCYLLNSRSLEYVYARYYAVPHGTTSRPRLDGGGARERPGEGATPSASSRGVAATVFSNGTVVTDCYGEVVSSSELRCLLSYSYLSYLFVYYDLITEGDEAEQRAGEVEAGTQRRPHVVGQSHGAGLYLRFPARWSFSA